MDTIKSTRKIEMLGKRFGKLIVILQVENDKKFNHIRWLCQCDCGNKKIVAGHSLRCKIKPTQSCGCICIDKNYTGYEGLSGQYWTRIKNRAKEAKYEFSIDIKEAWDLLLKQNSRCALSGVSIKTTRNMRMNYKDQTASLDRIDSTKGYTSDNIQWVHKDVNKMKMDFDEKEFIQMCKNIADYRFSKEEYHG